MAYTVMAFPVMAYIVMACMVMANTHCLNRAGRRPLEYDEAAPRPSAQGTEPVVALFF